MQLLELGLARAPTVKRMNRTINCNDIIICIVLYNQSLQKCITLNTMPKPMEGENLHILIYDNSPVPLTNVSNVKKDKCVFYYKHDANNGGVANAYNYCGELGKDLGSAFLFLFDQDTQVAENYFEKMFESINTNPKINLFSPISVSNKMAISPSAYYMGRAFLSKKIVPGVTPTKLHTLINSGLAISTNSFFELKGYDTKLKLDFSDHYFFYKYKKLNRFFCIVDSINFHQFSTFHDSDYEKVLKRFKIYFSASVNFSKKVKSLLPLIWAVLRAFKLSIAYKKTSFIAYTLHLFRK